MRHVCTLQILEWKVWGHFEKLKRIWKVFCPCEKFRLMAYTFCANEDMSDLSYITVSKLMFNDDAVSYQR